MQMVQNVCLQPYKKYPHALPMEFFLQKYIAFSEPSRCI